MAKRCIGIEIDSCHLRAVQMARIGQRFRIEKVFCSQTRRSTDSIRDILRSLTSRHGFDRRADVAISIPHNAVFFRDLQLDSPDPEQIHKHDSRLLEHNFPIQTDDIIAQVYAYRQLADEKCSVLIAAIARESLKGKLDLLADVKMRPKIVDSAIFAIHSTIALNHPEIVAETAVIAYVDESYLTLALTQNGEILLVRNIPIVPRSDTPDLALAQIGEVISREAQITWRRVLPTENKGESQIYLVAPASISAGLKAMLEENLRCQTVVVDPCAKIKRPIRCKADWQICVAEGLALRALAPEKTTGVNFLNACNAQTEAPFSYKKEIAICATLCAAIAVFLVVGLFLRRSYLEADYTNLKDQITGLFQRTLPGEKNIVSPVAQLQQKLDSVRKDYRRFASFGPTRLTPLQVLYTVSTNTPPQANIEIQDLLIAADSVRLTGTCNSFESVYEYRRVLAKTLSFALVDVKDVQKEPKSGAVRFTVLVSAASTEQG
ncbi:MAG: pilus assembly protein PilM [Phycisphaerales bacterium]|nr:MAG: pilus assembly protein PilM [Phycisphaerales bacterium]